MLSLPDWMLRWLTHVVFWFEGYGVIFYFIPFFTGNNKNFFIDFTTKKFFFSSTGPFRTLAALAVFGMHLGFGMSLRLGQFSVIATFAASILLFPSWFWDHFVNPFIKCVLKKDISVEFSLTFSGLETESTFAFTHLNILVGGKTPSKFSQNFFLSLKLNFCPSIKLRVIFHNTSSLCQQ